MTARSLLTAINRALHFMRGRFSARRLLTAHRIGAPYIARRNGAAYIARRLLNSRSHRQGKTGLKSDEQTMNKM